MAYAGMCHSDEHLRTGDITAPPELLEHLGDHVDVPRASAATRAPAW